MPAFPPIVGDNPSVLVLGSMPGRASLEKQQYYAHPQNCFWWIMAAAFEQPVVDKYAQRESLARENQIAIWDVLYDCERHGSLDSNIVKKSEQVNDFSSFLTEFSSIGRVLFNGGAAHRIFRRHCAGIMRDHPEIEWLQMPSTSPAFASMRPEQKLAIWRLALNRE